VDSAWEASIRPLLLKRFPAATQADLLQAHSYAYGGCILQDMGYYPFGSRLFSDLTHYVRSGDFIVALMRESQDLNEYAFALGALAHYSADNRGHPIATNLAVPMLYPKLMKKFGNKVTYWDDHASHIKTEFGFDVLQVASGHYASDHYRDFIGFHVAKPVLERAFLATYGVELKDVVSNMNLALGSFRYSVKSVIPSMTVVAWKLKGTEIQKETPGITRDKFLYNLSRSSYETEWGAEYQKAGMGTKVTTFLFRIVPKIGPFRALAFRLPSPEVEKMFMASFNATLDSYRALLADESAGRLKLPNANFDIGELTTPGRYEGADIAYDDLLAKLANHQFDKVSEELRAHLLAYYQARTGPAQASSKKAAKDWTKVASRVEMLRAASAAATF
jgi:hypothetical protein